MRRMRNSHHRDRVVAREGYFPTDKAPLASPLAQSLGEKRMHQRRSPASRKGVIRFRLSPGCSLQRDPRSPRGRPHKSRGEFPRDSQGILKGLPRGSPTIPHLNTYNTVNRQDPTMRPSCHIGPSLRPSFGLGLGPGPGPSLGTQAIPAGSQIPRHLPTLRHSLCHWQCQKLARLRLIRRGAESTRDAVYICITSHRHRHSCRH
jgi:hypothetical protein